MYSKEIIEATKEYVKKQLSGETTGHDWWHSYRVWKTAKHIGKIEKTDLYVVELAALLHDIGDYKFHNGDEKVGPKMIREWLESKKVEENVIEDVLEIISTLSFKGKDISPLMKTKEGRVVQDADRLDAIGAIGIARAFATGAKFNEAFYDPKIEIPKYKSKEEYVKAKGKVGRIVINHFYEKLLLLKELMNTEAGKKIAEERHQYMEGFVERFVLEWEGER